MELTSSPDGELYEELVALGVYEHGLSEAEALQWAFDEAERYKARWIETALRSNGQCNT